MTSVDPTKSIDEPPTYDAQQMKEAIATGDEETPEVNTDTDYERSKKLSSPAQPSSDMKPIGSLETTAEINAPARQGGEANSGELGDPENFRDMARDVNQGKNQGEK